MQVNCMKYMAITAVKISKKALYLTTIPFRSIAAGELSYRRRNTMKSETRKCRLCGAEIPEGRLRALPDTLLCVRCSKKIGGEFELKVTVSGTGKAGSLKKTGQEVSVKRQRKPSR